MFPPSIALALDIQAIKEHMAKDAKATADKEKEAYERKMSTFPDNDYDWDDYDPWWDLNK